MHCVVGDFQWCDTRYILKVKKKLFCPTTYMYIYTHTVSLLCLCQCEFVNNINQSLMYVYISFV